MAMPQDIQDESTGSTLLSWLTPDPRNTRTHTERNLALIEQSLREVGAARSIVVDESEMVLAGNATVEAAAKAGIAQVRIVEADGAELLAAAEVPLADLLGDPDDVPDMPADPVTHSGDLWLLGEHRLVCGDVTQQEDLDRLIAGEHATCLWTDPPSGVNYTGGTKDALTIANDDAAGLDGLLRGGFGSATDVLVPGAAFYLAHQAGPLSLVFLQVVTELGWKLRQTLVWVKDRLVLGHSDYHYQHEPILYGVLPGGGRRGRGAPGLVWG